MPAPGRIGSGPIQSGVRGADGADGSATRKLCFLKHINRPGGLGLKKPPPEQDQQQPQRHPTDPPPILDWLPTLPSKFAPNKLFMIKSFGTREIQSIHGCLLRPTGLFVGATARTCPRPARDIRSTVGTGSQPMPHRAPLRIDSTRTASSGVSTPMLSYPTRTT